MVRATCPKDKDHDKFITTTHVLQEWIVDKNGDFVDEKEPCIQVVHSPHKDNLWECAICGIS